MTQMIYGIVPVGGVGARLSLPYSKEMLPQKNFDYYNPIANHLVEKMQLAGASKIIFVHGLKYKEDVRQHFNDAAHVHILGNRLGFANVLYNFYEQIKPNDQDIILFGMPDSVFDNNLFVEMINFSGTVCGLFTTTKQSKVDRLDKDGKSFLVKTEKTDDNQDFFWGLLKFDGSDIKSMVLDQLFDKHSEIGEILNLYNLKMVYGDSYMDLGTWLGYNCYLADSNNFSNVEIEKKYDASNVKEEDFIGFFTDDTSWHEQSTYKNITSTDYYYTVNNSNVEFVRYREKSNDPGAIADLTIKNYNKSQLNRFELSIPLADTTKTQNVIYFLSILGANFEFCVEKRCHIFTFPNYTIVYYTFSAKNKQHCIIEIELHKIDFNLIRTLEDKMNALQGFDSGKLITKSKFQLIREQPDDTSH